MWDSTPLKHPGKMASWLRDGNLERFSFITTIIFHLIQDGMLHAKGEARWTFFPAAVFVTCRGIIVASSTYSIYVHLIFLRSSINQKHVPPIDSVLSWSFVFFLPLFPHISHPSAIPPGTEGLLLALWLGPGGGLPKLDRRGALPSLQFVGDMLWEHCD